MIADGTHVRLVGNLPAAVTDAMLKPHLRAAATRLKDWVSESVYTVSETEVDTARAGLGAGEDLDIDTLSVQAQALIDAEAYLCLNIALPHLNLVMKDDAGIAQSGTTGKTNWQYLDAEALVNLQGMYLRNAELAAQGYIIKANLGPARSPAYGSDGSAINSDSGSS